MLIRSTNKNEKIILGLLSYTLEDATNQTEHLTTILEHYRQTPNREFLLYREQETDNFIGLVGIETYPIEEGAQQIGSVLIDRIAIVPSFRHESVGYQLFKELKERYPESAFIGSRLTSELIVKWSQRYAEETSNN